jgi:hypothetical protein
VAAAITGSEPDLMLAKLYAHVCKAIERTSARIMPGRSSTRDRLR